MKRALSMRSTTVDPPSVFRGLAHEPTKKRGAIDRGKRPRIGGGHRAGIDLNEHRSLTSRNTRIAREVEDGLLDASAKVTRSARLLDDGLDLPAPTRWGAWAGRRKVVRAYGWRGFRIRTLTAPQARRDQSHAREAHHGARDAALKPHERSRSGDSRKVTCGVLSQRPDNRTPGGHDPSWGSLIQ